LVRKRREELVKKAVFGITLTLLLIGLLTLAFPFGIQPVKAESRIWTVDDDGPADFPTIQGAINAASSGDTIFVKAGTYFEHLTVDKKVSIIGENRTSTIVDGIVGGNKSGRVFYVSANSVVIKEFTIKNGDKGVYFYRSNSSAVMQSNVIENVEAVLIRYSRNSTVYGNIIANNIQRGILVTNSRDFSVNNNSVYGNGWYGIHANDSINGLIVQNNAYENGFDGIGIHDGCRNVTIVGNYVKDNSPLGIWVEAAYDNFIYHNNFIDNNKQVGLANSANHWDNGVEGNYWSNYTGFDNNHDGVGDTPHVLDGSNQDNCPLMGIFSDFSASLGYDVHVISNSTLEDFEFFESNNTIKMYVSNTSSTQSFGFVRMCISKGLMSPLYTVTIDDGMTEVLYFNGTIHDNSTHRWIYFAYPHSTHKVVIQGFPPLDFIKPTVSILSPENKTYPVNNVSLTFNISEPISWIGYSLDGQINVTVAGNITLPELPNGLHSLIVYANDTAGNMGSSDIVYFTIHTSFRDVAPPSISIVSPKNKTYEAKDLQLIFILNEPVLWMAYSLDNEANVTIMGNITLFGLSDGLHSLIVYAKDIPGNIGASEMIFFNISRFSKPFPMEIAAAIVVIAGVGTVLLVYLARVRKTSEKRTEQSIKPANSCRFI